MCSAAVITFDCGAFATTMPRFVAASTSTLSTPTPARPIARIAHCGYFAPFDIVITFAAFEMTLRELGHEVELGAGVAAAQRVFAEAGVPLGSPA